MKLQKYISKFGKECEIVFRVKKDILDIESCLYRFQTYIGGNVFGCDLTISNHNIEKYKLIDEEIINICFGMIRKILDGQIEEYCSIRIGGGKIIEYLVSRNNFDRINKTN